MVIITKNYQNIIIIIYKFNTEKDEEVRERDQMRYERHKERARDRNLARAAPDKRYESQNLIFAIIFKTLVYYVIFLCFRTKLQKERERDISEQIALGLPAKNISSETQFDQRLFNTSKGMDSGYGDDSSYNVYDKPWRGGASIGQHIYRPSKNVDKDIYGDDIDKIIKTNRYFYYSINFFF